MKQKLLKTILVALALVTGSMGMKAQISISDSEVSYGFDDGIAPFSEGTIQSANTSIGNVLTTGKTGKAVAYFGENNGSYTLKENETVTFSFVAYQGWYPDPKVAKVSIKDTDGNELIGYTYDHKDCNVTDVRIGGTTVDGFTKFFGQCYAGNKHANQYTGSTNQNFSVTKGYNPVFTFSISSSGFVSFSFKYECKGTDKKYKGRVSTENGVKLQSLEITDEVTDDNRCIGIDNLTVNSVVETTYGYTINYKYGNDIVATDEGQDIENAVITAKSIVNDSNGDRYFAVVDGTSGQLTVTSTPANNVLNVEVRKPYTATLNVTYMCDGTTLGSKSNSFVEADDNSCKWNYSFPAYIVKDGNYYCVGEVSQYGESGSFNNGEEINKTVNYKKEDNIVFFEEWETQTLSTSTYPITYNDLSFSDGKGRAIMKTDSQMSLSFNISEKGIYKIEMPYKNPNSRDREHKIYIDDTAEDKVSVGANGVSGLFEKELPLDAGSHTIKIECVYSLTSVFDYAVVRKTADLATVSSVGFATYSPSSNVVVPENVNVYTVTVDAGENSVTLHQVDAGSVLAAGTGYVIEAAEGSYPFAVSSDAVSSIGENALTVSDGTVNVGASDNIYVLAQRKDGSVGFSKVASGVTIPKGKAYLNLSGSQAASFLSFGIITAIESTESTTKAGNGVYYSLQGIRTSAPAKGIYIINGKKVVVK